MITKMLIFTFYVLKTFAAHYLFILHFIATLNLLISVKDDDSTSNTKARELHQPSGFARLRVAQVP